MSSLELALPSALLGGSYAAPAVTASVVLSSSLATTITTEWGVSPYHIVNGTAVPATAVTTILQSGHLCSGGDDDDHRHQEEAGEHHHQTTNTCLLDTAVQQTAGGGSGGDDNYSCGSSSSSKTAAAAMTTGTGVASPSPQEKWWGGSLLTPEGGSLLTKGVEEEDKNRATAVRHPAAERAAAMWGNLAILSGAMTVAVGVILCK